MSYCTCSNTGLKTGCMQFVKTRDSQAPLLDTVIRFSRVKMRLEIYIFLEFLRQLWYALRFKKYYAYLKIIVNYKS